MHPQQAIDGRQSEDEGSHKQGKAIPGEFHEAGSVLSPRQKTVHKNTKPPRPINPKIENTGKAPDLRIEPENPAVAMGSYLWQARQRP
jgi:hypothetical protein